MAYEIYSRKVRRVGSPQIALMRNGRVSFNKASTTLLTEQAVEYVLLLWDKAGRKIGLRPIAKKDARAYKVSIRDNSSGFSAKTFLEDIGFDYEKGTQLFPLTWVPEQGIFEMNLSDGVVSQRQPLKAKEKVDRPLLAAVGAKAK